jgi:hypothetical protein
MRVLLSILLLNTAAFAENGVRYISSENDLLGCWERITFPPAIMAQFNKIEPWPEPYQWYCFYEGGVLRSVRSSVPIEVGTGEELAETLNSGRSVISYTVEPKGQVTTHHLDANETFQWTVSVGENGIPKESYGTEVPAGSIVMMMNVVDKDKKMVYVRFLKRVH